MAKSVKNKNARLIGTGSNNNLWHYYIQIIFGVKYYPFTRSI